MDQLTPLKFKTVEDLLPPEKMELVAFASTSYFPLVCKLMEFEVLAARDRAVTADASKEAEQRARLTEARGMWIFYSGFQKAVKSAVDSHMGTIKQKAIQEELQDQEYIESLIVGQ